MTKEIKFLTYELENGERLPPSWGLLPNVGDLSAAHRVKAVIHAPIPTAPNHFVVVFSALPKS
jgi:hypothetical protein